MLAGRERGVGWPAWRAQPWAFTVVFPRPPQPLLDRWPLATDERGNAHVVLMPGVPPERVDRFVADLRDTVAAASGLLPGALAS
ncbi:hypothetical protein ACQP1P_35885 [Dactylosporangium sp. CA-052675]|uniref:hypothetical protein n=1 Tax=Dactylosporangium sp. CA-052675 TaxID=3239927 RepID=UPI003D8C4D20